MTAKTTAKKTTSKKAPGDIVEIQDSDGEAAAGHSDGEAAAGHSDGDSDGNPARIREIHEIRVAHEIHEILRTLQDEIDALKKFLKAKEPEIKRLREAQKKLERFRAIRNNLGNRAIRMLDGR